MGGRQNYSQVWKGYKALSLNSKYWHKNKLSDKGNKIKPPEVDPATYKNLWQKWHLKSLGQKCSVYSAVWGRVDSCLEKDQRRSISFITPKNKLQIDQRSKYKKENYTSTKKKKIPHEWIPLKPVFKEKPSKYDCSPIHNKRLDLTT